MTMRQHRRRILWATIPGGAGGGGGGDPTLTLHYNFLQNAGSPISAAVVTGPALTFTRASTGSYFNESGLLIFAAVNAPRFNHDPANGNAPLGLLIEDARTNVCLQSEDLSTTWTNPGLNTTITPNVGVAPDGATTAEDVLHGDSVETIQQAITAVDNNTYFISAFVKQGTTGAHDFVKIAWLDNSAGANGFEAWFNIAAGTVGTAQANGTGIYVAGSAAIRNVGGGWFRISAAGRIPAGQTDARFEIINTTANAVNTAETVDSVFWWGMQAELGSETTSYIPTTTTSATRARDLATFTDMSFLSEAVGTFVLRAIKPPSGTDDRFAFQVDAGGGSHRFYLRETSSGRVQMISQSTGLAVGSATPSNNIAPRVSFKWAGVYAQDDMIAAVNSNLSALDNTVDVPHAAAKITGRLGTFNSAGFAWGSEISVFKYYNVRKPNTFLQSETA